MTFTKFFVIVLLIAGIYFVRSNEISSNAEREIGQQDIQFSYRNVEWICSSDVDCTTLGTSCVKERCRCKPNYVFNAAMTSCLKAATDYGGSCEETLQCTAYMQPGAICINGICTCSRGYHYIHGRCYKSAGLKEKCRTDDDCYVNSEYQALSCKNEVCRCSDGYYQREYRTCRLEAKEPGAECTIDLDCTYDKNAQCDKNFGCFVKSKNNTTQAVLRGPKYQALMTLDVQAVGSRILSKPLCTSDKDCKVIGEASCDLTIGICVCKRGHYSHPAMLRCVPEIGEKCGKGDISIINNAICRYGQWSCKGATVPSKNNRICRAATTKYEGYCTYDEQCYVFGPDAFCEKNKCRCNELSHYSKDNKFCWLNKEVEENCTIDEDCYVSNFGSQFICNNDSVCACPKSTHLNAAGTGCVNDVPLLSDPCTASVDCKGINNSMCFNKSCSCMPMYFELSGECVNGIFAPCKFNEDCKAENSECYSNYCRCIDGYVEINDGLCSRGVAFGDKCLYDAECKYKTFKSNCNSTGKCSCDKYQLHQGGMCRQIKGLGDKCNFGTDACWDAWSTNESMSCNIDHCRCNEGFKPSYNWIYCERDNRCRSSSVALKYEFTSWFGLMIFGITFMNVL